MAPKKIKNRRSKAGRDSPDSSSSSPTPPPLPDIEPQEPPAIPTVDVVAECSELADILKSTLDLNCHEDAKLIAKQNQEATATTTATSSNPDDDPKMKTEEVDVVDIEPQEPPAIPSSVGVVVAEGSELGDILKSTLDLGCHEDSNLIVQQNQETTATADAAASSSNLDDDPKMKTTEELLVGGHINELLDRLHGNEVLDGKVYRDLLANVRTIMQPLRIEKEEKGKDDGGGADDDPKMKNEEADHVRNELLERLHGAEVLDRKLFRDLMANVRTVLQPLWIEEEEGEDGGGRADDPTGCSSVSGGSADAAPGSSTSASGGDSGKGEKEADGEGASED